nr:cadherin-related family member 5 [Loxodonta africana]
MRPSGRSAPRTAPSWADPQEPRPFADAGPREPRPVIKPRPGLARPLQDAPPRPLLGPAQDAPRDYAAPTAPSTRREPPVPRGLPATSLNPAWPRRCGLGQHAQPRAASPHLRDDPNPPRRGRDDLAPTRSSSLSSVPATTNPQPLSPCCRCPTCCEALPSLGHCPALDPPGQAAEWSPQLAPAHIPAPAQRLAARSRSHRLRQLLPPLAAAPILLPGPPGGHPRDPAPSASAGPAAPFGAPTLGSAPAALVHRVAAQRLCTCCSHSLAHPGANFAAGHPPPSPGPLLEPAKHDYVRLTKGEGEQVQIPDPRKWSDGGHRSEEGGWRQHPRDEEEAVGGPPEPGRQRLPHRPPDAGAGVGSGGGMTQTRGALVSPRCRVIQQGLKLGCLPRPGLESGFGSQTPWELKGPGSLDEAGGGRRLSTDLDLEPEPEGGPPLLLPLLLVGLLGQVPGTQAQACSVNKTFFEIEENKNLTEPLVDIYVPEGQQVTLGSSSTPSTFQIQNNQLFLSVIPDYESEPLLQAHLECRRGDTVVTQLRVFVSVLDVNDKLPIFPFTTKVVNVSEDTKVNSIVIPETDLEAQDDDKDDMLFYTLQEVTPGTDGSFSLVGTNRPALRLDKLLDFDRCQSMTFQLLVRDTEQEDAKPSHTATATLTLNILPADLRPPWFLPCVYSDSYVCIQAQYQGAIPTGHRLPDPLTWSPGPIYAVDGDRGINQPIIYSFVDGKGGGVFSINESSGNLTMIKDVLSPTNFMLLVKGEQADLARYSVTQVSVEARATSGSPPSFSQSLYRGTVALGSGVGTVIKDAATPSQSLRVQAQDPDFPDINSAITYRITNHSYFRMEGEVVLTAVALDHVAVFYAEVEAKNTVTSATVTTVVEIQVREQEPLPTEAGSTTGPSSSAPSEGTRPPGPSQGPSTTSSGGGTGPHPPSDMTLRTPALPTPGGPSSMGTSTSPSPAAPSSGGSAPTVEPGISQLTSQGSTRTSWSSGPRRGVSPAQLVNALVDRRLVDALAPQESQPGGFENQTFAANDEANWAPAPSPAPAEGPPPAPKDETPAPPDKAPPSPVSPVAARAEGSPTAVRSILTKERRPEGGYKAVWFGEDIGAEADVVVLNEPTADGAGDLGSEGSGNEDADPGRAGGPLDEPDANATYI